MVKPKQEDPPWWAGPRAMRKLADAVKMLDEADATASTLEGERRDSLRVTIQAARDAFVEIRARFGRQPFAWRTACALFDACERIMVAANLGAHFHPLAHAHCLLGMARVLALTESQAFAEAVTPKKRSRAAELRELALVHEHAGLTPTRLNSLLPDPIEERDARRVVNEARMSDALAWLYGDTPGPVQSKPRALKARNRKHIPSRSGRGR